MAPITSPQSLEPSTSVTVGHTKIQQTHHCRRANGLVLAAIERIDHTYHLGTCVLPGNASEKMVGLKVWHSLNTGRWQAIGAYMLCKKSYIAIGTLGVSPVPSIGHEKAKTDMSIATQRFGSAGLTRDAIRKPGSGTKLLPEATRDRLLWSTLQTCLIACCLRSARRQMGKACFHASGMRW